MRFYRPTEHSTRIKSGFCILPKTIGNETRWLEWAEWEEKLEQGDCRDYVESKLNWTPARWAA